MIVARRALSVLLVGAGLVTLGWWAWPLLAGLSTRHQVLASALAAVGWLGLGVMGITEPAGYGTWRFRDDLSDRATVARLGPIAWVVVAAYLLLVAPWLDREEEGPDGF